MATQYYNFIRFCKLYKSVEQKILQPTFSCIATG